MTKENIPVLLEHATVSEYNEEQETYEIEVTLGGVVQHIVVTERWFDRKITP